MTNDQIAEKLLSAALNGPEQYMKQLGDLFADPVYFAKVGQSWPKDVAREHQRAEAAAFRRAMADYRLENIEILARGHEVLAKVTMAGTLDNGTAVSAPIHWIFTVKGGEIAEVQTTLDQSRAAPLIDVLRASGIGA